MRSSVARPAGELPSGADDAQGRQGPRRRSRVALNHVANKGDLLDGMIDLAFSEIEPPAAGGDGKAELRKRALSTRRALGRHRRRADGGPHELRALEPRGPRRGAGLPARGRLLGRDDRPRHVDAGRLHLRLRAAAGGHGVGDGGRLRGRGAAPDGRLRGRAGRLSAPRRGRRRLRGQGRLRLRQRVPLRPRRHARRAGAAAPQP
jgi:hypothetical protein